LVDNSQGDKGAGIRYDYHTAALRFFIFSISAITSAMVRLETGISLSERKISKSALEDPEISAALPILMRAF
jgi:hypothetical protein